VSAERRSVKLHVSLAGERNLTEQIRQQISRAIDNGWLRTGDVLPSTRDLSEQLAVSRNTVATAYERLKAEGLVHIRPGGGTYVSGDRQSRDVSSQRGSPLQPRPLWDSVPEPADMSLPAVKYDLRPGIPDASQFPFATWRALVATELRPAAVATGSVAEPAGHPKLRAAIARHLQVARGVPANADDVIVTNGRQQAIDLVARVLLKPGDEVAVEDPGDLDVHAAFMAQEARTVAVPVDDEGLVVEAIPDGVRLVYVTPAHQFPLGMTMSVRRRMALLEWADRVDAAIIEDDSYGDLRYGGRPLATIYSLDKSGRVLYIGSFSRLLLATLRLGFLVAPTQLYGAVRKARHAADRHTDIPIQGAMARFLDTGLLAKHVKRMRAVYIERRRSMRNVLTEEFSTDLEVLPSTGGLHLVAMLRNELDDTAVARRAHALGVGIQPMSSYFRASGQSGFAIGYGAIRTRHIADGLRLFRECLD
jgi:GntR family transcriptional regulator / MocR family aminotransferase